ncbi:MAG: hypothetical protein ACI82F_001557 [Planctomycetota bacterium]|jgi:hypothetical protein
MPEFPISLDRPQFSPRLIAGQGTGSSRPLKNSRSPLGPCSGPRIARLRCQDHPFWDSYSYMYCTVGNPSPCQAIPGDQSGSG